MDRNPARPNGARGDADRELRDAAEIRNRTPQSAVRSTFDQTNVAGARSLLRFFRREFDALTFAQQFENGSADRAAMEEMLDAAFVADESESFVDEEPCDCPGWHAEALRSETPRGIPRGLSRLRAPADER